ncbi:hypothetical protein [Granulimonas faecalis]|uniref:hypothetical protein n=1 Tax=Granulimonas faecalis TaxID=2894155 RepID=UPI00351454F2
MATAFYGTMSIATSVIGDPAFKSLWDATLDGYDEARLTYGITSVYGSDEEGGRTVYQVSGKTDDGFDEDAAACLCGSLSVEDAGRLLKALEDASAAIAFDIDEYDVDADSLTREKATVTVEDGRARLSDTSYDDVPVTSRKLVDMGFAEESELDDEELAVMVAAEIPDGPEADDLVDAIEDLREDARHDGVFTAEETADPVAFAQMLEASYADEDDIE